MAGAALLQDCLLYTSKQKNIDTGMGLERLACIVQDVDSMFDIDTLKALRDQVCEIAGVSYGDNESTDVSLRVLSLIHIYLRSSFRLHSK